MRIQLFRTRARLRREAASWLARLKAGDGGASDEAFWQWHNAHPANAEAFARVSRTYENAGLLRNSPVIRERSLEPRTERAVNRRSFAFASVIAGLLLVPIVAEVFHQFGLPPFEGRETYLLATGIGEIRRVNLGNGTEMTLDTQSRVRVDSSSRHAVVEQGRVRFAIAKGGRAFIISFGSRQIESAGGIFDVDLTSPAGFLRLLSGNAEVSESAQPRGMRVARSISIHPDQLRSSPVQSGADWTSGVLQFDATPLADAAAAANRYSRNRIVLSGPGLGSITVTGAFRAGDNARLAQALAETLDLDSARTADGNFLLTGRRSKKKVG